MQKAEEKTEVVERQQTTLEEIGNAVTHGLGFVFGIVALILLLVKANTGIEYFSVFFYSIGLMILYIMSCLYHSFKHGSKVKRVFRRFDHSSIYLLIGGTYAPILLLQIGGLWGWVMFGIQWTCILLGIIFKAIDPTKYFKFHLIIYVILGWSGIFFMPQIFSDNRILFWLILSGGFAYSGGILFFVEKFKSAHFIWHFFVIFGSVLHFIGIYGFLL